MKKFLTILLALLMSLSMASLFACSEEPEEPVVEEPTPVVKNEVAGKYVIDYQVFGANKMAFEYGDDEVEVVNFTADMMGKETVVKYSDDENNYTQSITLNAITENYYNIDADSTAAGYKLATTAKATGLKVNGAEIDAEETGITVADDGISFTLAYLNGKKGHNKVEYVVGDTNYIVSVCVINNKDIKSAVTFEDGKISPMIAILSDATSVKVVNSSKVPYGDGIYSTSNLVDTYDSATQTHSQAGNTKVLAIVNNSSEVANTTIWVSMDYYKARIAAVEEALKGIGVYTTEVKDGQTVETSYTKNRIGCGRMVCIADGITGDTTWETYVPSATAGEDDVRLTSDGWGLSCSMEIWHASSKKYVLNGNMQSARPNWDSLSNRPTMVNADAPYFYISFAHSATTTCYIDDILMANSGGYPFSNAISGNSYRNMATIIK